MEYKSPTTGSDVPIFSQNAEHPTRWSLSPMSISVAVMLGLSETMRTPGSFGSLSREEHAYKSTISKQTIIRKCLGI